MTVIRPNSISGITSLTAHRGSIDFYAHDGSAARFDNINSNVTSGVSTFASLNITGDLDVGGALTYEDVTNIDSVGLITARAGVKVPDGQKIFIGTDDDLQIYHDSSWNYIQSHNSKNFVIQVRDNENAFVAIPDGEVQLYHNNSKKFETTSSGVKVSGSFPDFIIHDTDTTNDNFRILHNSGGTQLQVDPNNVSSGSYLLAAIDGTERLRIDDAGRLLIGRTSALASSAERLTIDDGMAMFRRNNSNAAAVYIRNEDSTADTRQPYLIFTDGSGNRGGFGVQYNESSLWISGQNGIAFRTGGTAPSTTERLRIDSSGRLLISGEAALTSTSLSHSLQVAAASNADGIAIIGRASDDISELSFYEADKTTNLGEIQYRQDHVNFRHRVGHMSFATGGVSERIRIKSNGVVQVANAAHGTDNGSRLLEVIGSGNSQAGFLVANNATSASGTCDITFAPSNKVAGAQIFCEAQEDFSTGANRTADLTFITRKDGTLAEKVRISSAGYVTKPYQPCAMAYNAQGQHMAGGSIAQFNSTRFNIGNMYNSSNGRMTVPVAGRYLVAYSGLHDYISQSAVGFDVRINGSAFNGGEGYQESNDISNSQLSKTLILSLSANDYVEIYIRQSGTQVHQRYGSFSMCLIT